MKTKAIDEIIEQKNELYRTIDEERRKLSEEVEQRRKDARDKQLVDKVSYLVGKLGESNYLKRESRTEKTFACSNLALKFARYSIGGELHIDTRIDYNCELCFFYTGHSQNVETYIPGEWEEKLDELFLKCKDIERKEEEKKLEEAELEKHRRDISHAEAGWKAEEAELRKKFGL